MFEAGEWILYGNLGLCRVKERTTPSFCAAGEERLYYVLEPKEQRGLIYVPVDAPVFMRRVMRREEAEALIDLIPAVKAEAFHSSRIHELVKHYGEAMQSHRSEELVALLKSIYAKKQDRLRQNQKVGAVDEEFMRKAENLLHGELAMALGIEKNEVEGYIAARIARRGEKD